METGTIIGINGIISAVVSVGISSIAYFQATKKNKTDFLNNQTYTIETEIEYIKDKTYELFADIFDGNGNVDGNLKVRLLVQKNNSLHTKILGLDDFKKFSDDVVEYNIFSASVIEANDKDSAQVQLDIFDGIYQSFKSKLCIHQNNKNK